MAKNILVGVNNIAKKPRNIYVGVDNKARKVKAVYVGVNGIARQCWPAGILPNSYTQLEYIDGRCGRIYANVNPLSYPRIVVDFSIFSNTADGNLFGGRYDNYEYSPDTGEGYQNSWLLYYDVIFTTKSSNYGFAFGFSAYNMQSDGYYPPQPQYYTNLYSNATERLLLNTNYTLDFLNNNNIYLYNSEGYYSISSHNYIGNISSKPTISNRRGEPYNYYNNAIRLFGGNGDVIYGCQIYNGSTLIRNYYPCYRNSDKYIGYYDMVNLVFYPCNSGTDSSPRYITHDEAIEAGYEIGPLV